MLFRSPATTPGPHHNRAPASPVGGAIVSGVMTGGEIATRQPLDGPLCQALQGNPCGQVGGAPSAAIQAAVARARFRRVRQVCVSTPANPMAPSAKVEGSGTAKSASGAVVR